MLNLVLVAAGGAVGAVARYQLGVQAARWPLGWPVATLLVNILGGLLMGLLAGFVVNRAGGDAERLRLLLGVGLLGGFTTFSAFSLEIVTMLDRRAWGQAAAYSLGSVVLSVAALGLGLMLARRFFA